jgi:hypothetical protein
MKLHDFSLRHPDLMAGLKQGALVGLIAAALLVPAAASLGAFRSTHAVTALPHVALRQPPKVIALEPRSADFSGHSVSDDARKVADWVADSRDNQQMPFVILDKRDARVYVFDASAHMIDSTPVLLGAAPGDESVVGIGKRPIAEVRPAERTTPAGRFVSTPGNNAGGEDVIWVDYDAAVSMHRVRPIDPKERRLERLASNDPTQRRISYGCINMPVKFFESVMKPNVGAGHAVVYVLPEVKDVHQVFTQLATTRTRTADGGSPATPRL